MTVEREFRLESEDAAELLRDMADAIEDGAQLNLDLGKEKLAQPLGGKTPLRIFQDENGTEVGFRLTKE